MLKDVKALSSANGPGLVHFHGAYLLPEAGEVTSTLAIEHRMASFQAHPHKITFAVFFTDRHCPRVHGWGFSGRHPE